ncbi:MAG: peptidase M14 [Phycisphaerales bacterium]|nr:peptidase M14 [Phycisphaerales bacterium]
MKLLLTILLIAGASLIGAGRAAAQPDMPGKVEIPFNRYYTPDELNDWIRKIGAAYPGLVEIKSIGKSLQGREILLAIVNNPETGAHDTKPAMWIDGNIHGNEVQAAEVVLYTLWYLTKNAGQHEGVDALLKDYSFYLLVCVNPDGRAHWFDGPNNSSSSRHNARPIDDDRDGQTGEDPDDDLDGDGSITSMWKEDPSGGWLRSQTDPRVFTRVKPGERGNWTNLGEEGLDNDGDGRINEDGPGGDDMNRNYPGDWQPEYVQFGAGPYPFSAPETRAIGDWILAHPNIAAAQSYHNSGGMILRGPGTEQRQDVYSGEDRRVYDELAQTGEKLLPFYRYLQTFKDLYPVHGGFTNWTFESLGIFSFVNEMWTPLKYFQRDDTDQPDDERTWIIRDKLMLGQIFKDYAEFDHPRYGKVLIGGPNKWSSRNTPTFMLEEECHRNFAFTMYHASQMPVLEFQRVQVKPLGDPPAGTASPLWEVTVGIRNLKLIPTRSGRQQSGRIGLNDLLTATGGKGVSVAAAGRLRRGWYDVAMDPVRHEPERIGVAEGIGPREERIFRFIVHGPQGGTLRVRYEAQKAKPVTREIELRVTE